MKESFSGTVVFLVDYIFEHKSPNAICAIEIIKQMRESAPNKRYIILYFSNQKKTVTRYLDGIECISVKDSYLNILSHKFVNGKRSLIRRIYFKILSKFFAAFNSLRFPISSSWISNRVFKRVSKIEKLEMIVGFCFPYEFANALVKIKRHNQSVVCVFYPLDVVSYGRYLNKGILKQIQKINSRRLEKKVVKLVDYSVLIETNQQDYSKRFKKYSNKIYYTGIPVLNFDKKVIQPHINRNNILFTGSLNSRDPSLFLKLIKYINEKFNKNYKVTFLGNNKVEHKYGFVVYKDFCSDDKLEDEIKNSFCLLNIGNLETHLVPSKLFRYLSVGMPIIHFSQVDNDPCEFYLKDIDNCLIINAADVRDNFEDACFSLKTFLESCMSRDNTFLTDGLKRSTVKYSANLLLDFLKNK